jgi:hypothetical protein
MATSKSSKFIPVSTSLLSETTTPTSPAPSSPLSSVGSLPTSGASPYRNRKLDQLDKSFNAVNTRKIALIGGRSRLTRRNRPSNASFFQLSQSGLITNQEDGCVEHKGPKRSRADSEALQYIRRSSEPNWHAFTLEITKPKRSMLSSAMEDTITTRSQTQHVSTNKAVTSSSVKEAATTPTKPLVTTFFTDILSKHPPAQSPPAVLSARSLSNGKEQLAHRTWLPESSQSAFNANVSTLGRPKQYPNVHVHSATLQALRAEGSESPIRNISVLPAEPPLMGTSPASRSNKHWSNSPAIPVSSSEIEPKAIKQQSPRPKISSPLRRRIRKSPSTIMQEKVNFPKTPTVGKPSSPDPLTNIISKETNVSSSNYSRPTCVQHGQLPGVQLLMRMYLYKL